MVSMKEQAEEYEPPQTKNIAELEKVPVSIKVEEETFTRKEPNEKGEFEEFTVKTITVDGEKYRVPVSVLGNLKEILKEKPDLEFFKVSKSGSGFGTTYTVIPL